MKIRMPQRAKDVVQALYDRHKDLAHGDDNQRRALTRLCAEQLAYEHPPVRVVTPRADGSGEDEVSAQVAWGTKRADGGRPPSKDALAVRYQGALWSADCFNGSTREPAVPDEFEALPGQVFIGDNDPLDGGEVLHATNHLGAPPDDGDGDDDDDVPSDLPARVSALEAKLLKVSNELGATKQAVEEMHGWVDTVERRVAKLETSGGGGSFDPSKWVVPVNVGTSKVFGHGHQVTTTLSIVPKDK